VLVHGSGPNDADESLGPNKPFRDLALGLAAHGVATSRYDKRTYARPATFSVERGYTVQEESVDDAIAAVRLAATSPGLDAKRVWVLGHSWGGALAPRIAAAAPEVAGLVILAGNTRPLEDVLVEQIAYLHGAGSAAVAMTQSLARTVRDPHLAPGQTVDVLGAKLPSSYFLDLRAYDPARTAAGLRVAILVLQGERDYQPRRDHVRGRGRQDDGGRRPLPDGAKRGRHQADSRDRDASQELRHEAVRADDPHAGREADRHLDGVAAVIARGPVKVPTSGCR
jgi:dienelactone hydrolase